MKEKTAKRLKKFFIYFGIILAVLISVVIICFAVLYFSPGTPVLGFEYVSYNKKYEKVFNNIEGVKCFEISTRATDINIFPNSENEIKIVHNQGFSGFTKEINSNLTLIDEIKMQSFEEDATEYKTFSIKIDEPIGLISKNNAYINIYLPQSLSFTTISARATSGNINYSTFFKNDKKEDVASTLQTANLYLKTSDNGKVNIKNDQAISNYYLKTGYSQLTFEGVSNLTANKIQFETDDGTFSFVNSSSSATLTLNDFLVKASGSPYITINNLLSNLKVEAESGLYKIDRIGSPESPKKVALTVNKAEINFGSVNGFVSILGKNGDLKNTINIGELKNSNNTNAFESGAGNVFVNLLDGHASFNSSSGNIKVNTIKKLKNVYAYSVSGNIDLNYEYDEKPDNNSKVSVFTHTGNVNLTNLSCFVNINVLEDSANAKINLTFFSIAFIFDSEKENIINARNREVNIALNKSLPNRIASTGKVSISRNTAGAQIMETDDDSLSKDKNKERYKNYTNNFRICYDKTGEIYNNKGYVSVGKILINAPNTNVNLNIG